MATITARPAHAYPAGQAVDPYLLRPMYLPLPFLIPLFLSGLSWIVGGSPTLTDMSFVSVTILGIVFLALEFYRFPRRFGIGGMLIFGGFLSWFCYDYFSNWYGRDFGFDPPFSATVIAKTAYFHMLFMEGMLVGLLLPPMKWLTRTMQAIPEPNSHTLYLWLILGLFVIGISPYFIFTPEPFYKAIYRGVIAARGGGGTLWTVGASGRINYNWGAYVAQILEVGQVGGQLAVFYAVLISRNVVTKVLCWLIWGLWLALAFGTGTRGIVAFMILPVIALMFLKYQSWAAMLLKKLSWRAYVYSTIVLVLMYVLIQIQGEYRTIGYRDVEFSKINVMQIKGNSMFSEGLPGWKAVPDQTGFFSNRFPGEAVIRPIPETAFWFVVKFIPRALWHGKPLDPMEEWYYDLATEGTFEATISTGLVGEWYFRYGWLGVVQGAILFGWLARTSERTLQTAGGKPLAILLSLGLATWLYRTFRNFQFHDLYPLIVGALAIFFVIKVFNQMNPQIAPAAPRR